MTTLPNPHPHIRSFARRRGHLSNGQANALQEGLPTWGIPFTSTPISFSQHWGESGPNWLEIGFGMGETTASLAQENPQVNYLGVEVYPAGVGALLRRIQDHNLSNIRIVQHDVVEVLQHMLPNQSLDRVLIFFPDPWRKTRHHKRRLIQSHFIEQLTPKLKPGAILHCATDWEHYAHHMLDVLGSAQDLRNLHAGFAPRPNYRPFTKFEQRGLNLGHGVWDLLFERIPTASD
jgi:tRNA (guanine-N7-)-methyltransferase